MLAKIRKSQPPYNTSIKPELKQYIQSARNYVVPAMSPIDADGNLAQMTKLGTVTDSVPSAGGIGVKGDGSSGLYYRAPGGTAQAMWMACTVVVNSSSSTQKSAYTLGDTIGAGAYAGISFGDGSAARIIASYRGVSGGSIIIKNGPNFVVGGVYNVVAVWPSNAKADAYVYVNGVKYTTDAASSADITFSTNWGSETVCGLRRGTGNNFYSPDTVVFTARGFGQIPEALARKISENPWFVFSDAPSRVKSAQALTGSSVNLSSEALATAAAFGSLSITDLIASSAQSIASSAGQIVVTDYLASIATAQTSTSGQISVADFVAALAAAQSSATGQLTQGGSLSGQAAGQSNVSGQLSVTDFIAANAQAVASTAGAISVIDFLSGLAAAVSVTTGNVNVAAAGSVSGTASGSASMTGGLSITDYIAGLSKGISNATAAVTVTDFIRAAAAAIGSMLGNLTSGSPAPAQQYAHIVASISPLAHIMASVNKTAFIRTEVRRVG